MKECSCSLNSFAASTVEKIGTIQWSVRYVEATLYFLKSLRSTRIAQQCYQCLYINILSHGFVLCIFYFWSFFFIVNNGFCVFHSLAQLVLFLAEKPGSYFSINTLIYLFILHRCEFRKPVCAKHPLRLNNWGKMRRYFFISRMHNSISIKGRVGIF